MLDLCKCCLEDGNFKDMWTEHLVDDEVEVYGNILNDCFGLSWEKPSLFDNAVEQICDTCISRLRHANYFKTLIQISENKLNEFMEKSECLKLEETTEPKSTADVCLKLEETTEPDIVADYIEEDNYEEVIYTDDDRAMELKPETTSEYDDDEYNEDTPFIDNDLDSGDAFDDLEFMDLDTEKFGRPKKKKVIPKRINKNYSELSLRMAVMAVLNENVSRSEAARIYGVPRKTIGGRIEKIVENGEILLEYAELPKMSERQAKLVEELYTILEYTNATPFKTRTGHIYCAYCSTSSEPLDDPAELRGHTLRNHPNVNMIQVDYMLQPDHLNEIIRVDIHNFRCNHCDIKLESWNDMIIHMKQEHDYSFDEALKKVIPFVLKQNMENNCALCNEKCRGILIMDNHMNYHYDSYICSICGIPLLTYKRFKKHEESHKPSRYSCNDCSKVFKSKRCLINHMQDAHDIIIEIPEEPAVKKVQEPKEAFCDICGKRYKNYTMLALHMRRTHNNEKRHDCLLCEMRFFSKGDLRKHMVTHTKEKRYECSICDKKFGTNWTLRQHYRIHPEVKIGKTDKVSKKIILTPA